MMKTFKIGGIHPESFKKASRAIEFLPLPYEVRIPLSQHKGAPARALVKRGDKVERGQLIAINSSFVSASLHAPISGVVASVEKTVMPDGKPTEAIHIKADEVEHTADSEARVAYWEAIVPGYTDRTLSERLSAEEIRKSILSAGIVGLGGATFPSHVKLTLKDTEHCDLLIINGCECEPYLMCDDALMCTYPARIVEGVELMMKAANIDRAVIAIEDNKPQAIGAIRAHLDPAHNIEVQIMKTKYPQGGEKQLIEAVTGRRVPKGELPLAVGVVVNNVATAFAVWQAVATSMPLIERVVTVSGNIRDEECRNYMVALGTPLSSLPFTMPDQAKVVVGGPMTGRSAVCLDAPVVKGTSGLTILKADTRRQIMPCVRCGACIDVCPMGLEPYLLSTYGRLHLWPEAKDADVGDCIECGSCSWACPSSRPLLEFIRIAKQRTR